MGADDRAIDPEKRALEIADLRANRYRTWVGAVQAALTAIIAALATWYVANQTNTTQQSIARQQQADQLNAMIDRRTDQYARALTDLGGRNTPARIGAVLVIGRFYKEDPEPETVAALTQALVDERDPNVASALIASLGESGTKSLEFVHEANRLSASRFAAAAGRYLASFPKAAREHVLDRAVQSVNAAVLPFDVQTQRAFENGEYPEWPSGLLHSQRIEAAASATIDAMARTSQKPSAEQALMQLDDAARAMLTTGIALHTIVTQAARSSYRIPSDLDLSYTVLIAADFRRTNLSGTNFTGAYINGDASQFSCNRCNFRDADIYDLATTSARVTNSNLADTHMQISMPDEVTILGEDPGEHSLADIRGSDWWDAQRDTTPAAEHWLRANAPWALEKARH
jgi:hypothetical protein